MALISGRSNLLVLQSPSRRRVLDKLSLRREEMGYRALFDDGVIGPELYTALRWEAAASRARVEARPPLDLGLKSRELVSKVPIFGTLTRAQLDSVARLLRPRFALPGELLVRDGGLVDAMYFLSSGMVEVTVLGAKKRLGPGDFFGEMALVTGRRRQGNVRALGYSQLLVLRARDFHDVLKRNQALEDTISSVVRTRVHENEEALSKSAT